MPKLAPNLTTPDLGRAERVAPTARPARSRALRTLLLSGVAVLVVAAPVATPSPARAQTAYGVGGTGGTSSAGGAGGAGASGYNNTRGTGGGVPYGGGGGGSAGGTSSTGIGGGGGYGGAGGGFFGPGTGGAGGRGGLNGLVAGTIANPAGAYITGDTGLDGGSGTATNSGGGGGGAGGYGAVATGSSPNSNANNLLGGRGGNGGYGTGTTGADGNSGAGGAGFRQIGATTFTNSGLTGGGTGGYGRVGAGRTSSGAGGAGGIGAILGSGSTLINTGTLSGGNGGYAYGTNAGAVGGIGGIGVLGQNLTINNTLFINGGSGGYANTSQAGAGGIGISTSNSVITNSGTINGGFGGNTNSGTVGAGGVGISGSAIQVTNSGTISGAPDGNGANRANAITFTGGANSLTITSTSGINGNVVVQNSAGATGTFGLGGDTTPGAAFSLAQLGPQGSLTAQYQGFNTLQKSGASTWTLSGAPGAGTTLAYQVGAGTLNLGGTTQTATSFLLTGGTLANGTLTSTGAFDVRAGTVSANLAGTGALTKTTADTVTLSGANTYTGATAVNAGTLNVTGTNTSAATVNNGGTLAGSGRVGGLTVNSGGIAYPGAVSGAPTTLNVAGNVTFANGSIFRVNLTPAAAGRITATGTATLNGGTVDVLAGSGTFTAASRYTLLSAAAGLTGRFSNLQTTTNLAFLTPTLAYDANNVFLAFTQATTTTTTTNPDGTTTTTATPVRFASVAATPNQRSTADGVQSLPAGNALFTAVLNQTAPGARQAFDQLSGEVHSSEVTSQFETAFMVQTAVLDRLRGFGPATGLGLAGATVPASFAADLPGGRKPEIAAVPFTVLDPRVFALWGQGFGSFGSTRTNGNAGTLTRDTGGFVIGVDATLDGTYRFGLAGGFTDTSLDVRARNSRGEVTSGFGAIYGGASFGAVQVRIGGAFAGNSTDTTRNVAFPGFSNTLTSRFGGTTLQGFGEIGYRLPVGAAATLEPFVGAAGIRISRDRFTETGGAGALTVFGRDYDTQTVTAGVRGEMALAAGSPFSLKGLVGYRHAFGDVSPVSLLAFAAGGSQFSTSGVPIDRDAVIAEAGVDWRVTRDVTLGLSYAGQAGERAQDHGVKGSVLYKF